MSSRIREWDEYHNAAKKCCNEIRKIISVSYQKEDENDKLNNHDVEEIKSLISYLLSLNFDAAVAFGKQMNPQQVHDENQQEEREEDAAQDAEEQEQSETQEHNEQVSELVKEYSLDVKSAIKKIAQNLQQARSILQSTVEQEIEIIKHTDVKEQIIANYLSSKLYKLTSIHSILSNEANHSQIAQHKQFFIDLVNFTFATSHGQYYAFVIEHLSKHTKKLAEKCQTAERELLEVSQTLDNIQPESEENTSEEPANGEENTNNNSGGDEIPAGTFDGNDDRKQNHNQPQTLEDYAGKAGNKARGVTLDLENAIKNEEKRSIQIRDIVRRAQESLKELNTIYDSITPNTKRELKEAWPKTKLNLVQTLAKFKQYVNRSKTIPLGHVPILQKIIEQTPHEDISIRNNSNYTQSEDFIKKLATASTIIRQTKH